MKQVDRYLHTVKFYLPAAQQDDILAELREDILAQIEDLETQRGHKLDEREIDALLKQRGQPVLVAGKYLPQQQLIGPAFFPIYRFVLKLVLLWVQIPIFIGILGPINLFTSSDPGTAIIQTIGQWLEAAFIAFGVITLIFAGLERSSAKAEPARPLARSRRTSMTDLFTAVSRPAVWIYLIGFHSAFDIGGLHLALAPVWNTIFWPVLVLLVCSVVRLIFKTIGGLGVRAHTICALTLDALGLAVLGFLFAAGPWVEFAARNLDAAKLANINRWLNINVAIVLMIAGILILVDAYLESKAFRRSPIGMAGAVSI